MNFDRVKDAPWFQAGIRPTVLVGGAGGIGSWLTLALNRAGFETYVYDNDIYESLNMAGQFMKESDVNKTKVEALHDNIKAFCGEEMVAMNEKVDENTMTNDIVFTGFDNIQARKDMFNSWVAKFSGNKQAIFIDGRLTAEQITIFCIKGDDLDGQYDYLTNHLPDDSTIEEGSCTFKQTSHNAMSIAAEMTKYFVNWYSGLLGRDEYRNTPYFYMEYVPVGYREQLDVAPPRPIEGGEGGHDDGSLPLNEVEVPGMISGTPNPILFGTPGEMEVPSTAAFMFFNPEPAVEEITNYEPDMEDMTQEEAEEFHRELDAYDVPALDTDSVSTMPEPDLPF